MNQMLVKRVCLAHQDSWCICVGLAEEAAVDEAKSAQLDVAQFSLNKPPVKNDYCERQNFNIVRGKFGFRQLWFPCFLLVDVSHEKNQKRSFTSSHAPSMVMAFGTRGCLPVSSGACSFQDSAKCFALSNCHQKRLEFWSICCIWREMS